MYKSVAFVYSSNHQLEDILKGKFPPTITKLRLDVVVVHLCLTVCDPMDSSCSNSCPLSQRCHPTISSLCRPLLSFAFNLFQHQGLFQRGGQSIGASASAPDLPVNIQGWFPLTDWFDLLAVQGTLKSLLQHHTSKASVLRCSAFFMVQLSQLFTTTGETNLGIKLNKRWVRPTQGKPEFTMEWPKTYLTSWKVHRDFRWHVSSCNQCLLSPNRFINPCYYNKSTVSLLTREANFKINPMKN